MENVRSWAFFLSNTCIGTWNVKGRDEMPETIASIKIGIPGVSDGRSGNLKVDQASEKDLVNIVNKHGFITGFTILIRKKNKTKQNEGENNPLLQYSHSCKLSSLLSLRKIQVKHNSWSASQDIIYNPQIQFPGEGSKATLVLQGNCPNITVPLWETVN